MILLCVLCSAIHAGVDDDLLSADMARTTNPAEFERLVRQLESSPAPLSISQQQFLNYLKGYQDIYSGRIDEGLSLYQGVLESTSEPDIKLRAAYSLANTYSHIGRYSEALEALDLALRLVPDVQDAEVVQLAHLAASVIYNTVGEFELGSSFAQRVLEKVQPGDRADCLARLQILESRIKQDRDLIDQYANEAIKSCQSAGEIMLTNISRTHYIGHLLDHDETEVALALLETHLPEAESTQFSRLVAAYHSLLAQGYFDQGQFSQSAVHADMAIQKSEGMPYIKPVVRSLDILHRIRQQEGNYEQALIYHQQYAVADKAYLDETQAKMLAFQKTLHELNEKDSRIELLNKENQVLTLQQNLDKEAAENTRLFLILLSVTIAFIALWAYRTKLNQIRFREMAQCDELTGAFNRRHFSELANQHLALAEKEKSTVSLVMFDLDHFKRVNDRFGHLVGDWVLQEVINVCRKFCREQDVFGRLGGEEFGIIMPSCSLEHAAEFAEKCRRHLSMIDTGPTDHEFSIHASFGVAESSRDGYRLKQLISAADHALYAAKSQGRNRVVTSELDQASALLPA